MIKPKTQLFYHFCEVKSMAITAAKNAVCPFYVEQSNKTIRCEGIVSHTLINAFKSGKKRDMHLDRFCNSFNYAGCAIARQLLKEYEKKT